MVGAVKELTLDEALGHRGGYGRPPEGPPFVWRLEGWDVAVCMKLGGPGRRDNKGEPWRPTRVEGGQVWEEVLAVVVGWGSR